MNRLLDVSKKVQQWIKAHPRKASIVQFVLDEFDAAIAVAERNENIAIALCNKVVFASENCRTPYELTIDINKIANEWRNATKSDFNPKEEGR